MKFETLFENLKYEEYTSDSSFIKVWDNKSNRYTQAMSKLDPNVRHYIVTSQYVITGGFVLRTIGNLKTFGVDLDLIPTPGLYSGARSKQVFTSYQNKIAHDFFDYVPRNNDSRSFSTCLRFIHKSLRYEDSDVLYCSQFDKDKFAFQRKIKSFDASCVMNYIDKNGIYMRDISLQDILANRLVLVNPPNPTAKLHGRLEKLIRLTSEIKFDSSERSRLEKVLENE